MTENISIQSLSSQALLAGELRAAFPEFYALQTVTENSLWHDRQVVFDHVIKVLQAFEQRERLMEQLTVEQRATLATYLATPVESHTRQEVLLVAVVLHDIAKTETLILHPDGIANCPGHELVAAARVPVFGPRFGLSSVETERLERIVRYHGFISDVVTRVMDTQQPASNWQLFQATVGDVSLELTVLMMADLTGSNLDQTDPAQFQARQAVLLQFLEQQLTSLAIS